MKVFLEEDEAWPVLVESRDGEEFDAPDELVNEWREAERRYWAAHNALLKATTRQHDR